MAKCWIVVTESARGRIFSADTHTREMNEIEDLIHSESRTRDRDLTSDRSGRAFDRVGGGRHAMSKQVSAHKHEIDSFARQIADRLNVAFEAGEFRQLRISAPPAFLGMLRKHLGGRVLDSLEQTLRKNLVHESVDVIKTHFFSPAKHSNAG